MNIIPTRLKGCFIAEPKVINDGRGYFMESYNEEKFNEAAGEKIHFVQDNQSFSTRDVVRGLHYQTGEHAQAKLVRVFEGEVLDIAVDIRPGSETYGQYEAVILSAENHRQFFVPRGFAHGFRVLSESAIFFYKCDNFYNKESEGGIMYNDPEIGIDWGAGADFLISDKDKALPHLKDSRAAW